MLKYKLEELNGEYKTSIEENFIWLIIITELGNALNILHMVWENIRE